MEYKIVSAFTRKGFEKDVNDLILEGWKPQGGIAIDTGVYVQAMIRE